MDEISSIPLWSLVSKKMQIWVYLDRTLEEETEREDSWGFGLDFLWDTTLKGASFELEVSAPWTAGPEGFYWTTSLKVSLEELKEEEFLGVEMFLLEEEERFLLEDKEEVEELEIRETEEDNLINDCCNERS